MSKFRWVVVAYGSEAYVDEDGEVHARVSEGWRGLATWGERQFISMEAAKRAVELAKAAK